MYIITRSKYCRKSMRSFFCQDVSLQLEKQVSRNLASGLTPRWSSLSFDPAMLNPPDQDVLSKLERELGWVK